MSQIKVTQVRSVIGRPKGQKDTVRRLGLRRMRTTAWSRKTGPTSGA